jgi:ATP-binding cassette, subfamily B, bacterial
MTQAPAGSELPELSTAEWLHHAQAIAGSRFWVVAGRLPGIVREALALGWRASRRDTATAVGLNLLASLMTTFGLLATSTALQELLAAGPTPQRMLDATPHILVAALAAACHGGLAIMAGWARERLAPQISYQVELRLFEATTAVDLAAFDDAGFAEDMDRARDRGMTEAASIVDDVIALITGLAALCASAAAVAVIQPVLLPCVLVAAVPSAITAVRVARREYTTMLARINRRRRVWMLATLMANRHTAAELRAYQMRGFLLGEYRNVMVTESAAQLRLVRAQTITRLGGSAASGVASAGVIAVLAVLLVNGFVPFAAAATALLALQTAKAGLRTSVGAVNQLYEDALYYGDYRAFLDRASQSVSPPAGKDAEPLQDIKLRRVSLRYPGGHRLAVDEVSLAIRRGEVVAFVGENGSGKSSLAKLIAGLYRPGSGCIEWNGVDRAGLDQASVAAQIAVVSQDWWRFPFTAQQNITIGRESSAHRADDVFAAARAASAHDLITALPRGYDTLLNREFRDGHDLSGGQWQRLVAARGFYRNATLLICDEPSAALDARAEQALFQQLQRRPDRTVILITHRLANVRHADRIYVLHDGQLVEEGNHDSLMSAGGRYADLFALQARGYADGK